MRLPKDKVVRFYMGVCDKFTKHTRFALWFKMLVILPFAVWLMMFNFYVQIPVELRPKIDVRTLPALENYILGGYSLVTWPRTVLSDDNPILLLLDFLAAFVYLIHFAFAWVFALFLYAYSRNRKTPEGHPVVEPWTFLLTMGILNMIAVATQISWPTAPPWYVNQYGEFQEANYEISGDAAGLTRVDQMIHFGLFKRLYGQSPIVFGSFPSLHAAWPIVISIFSPKHVAVKTVGYFYVATVWWAAVYLEHHYFVDLIGGAVFTAFSYMVATHTINGLVKRYKHQIYSRGSGVKWTMMNAGQVMMKEKDEDIECELVIDLPNMCQDDCWTPSKARRLVSESDIPLLKEH